MAARGSPTLQNNESKSLDLSSCASPGRASPSLTFIFHHVYSPINESRKSPTDIKFRTPLNISSYQASIDSQSLSVAVSPTFLSNIRVKSLLKSDTSPFRSPEATAQRFLENLKAVNGCFEKVDPILFADLKDQSGSITELDLTHFFASQSFNSDIAAYIIEKLTELLPNIEEISLKNQPTYDCSVLNSISLWRKIITLNLEGSTLMINQNPNLLQESFTNLSNLVVSTKPSQSRPSTPFTLAFQSSFSRISPTFVQDMESIGKCVVPESEKLTKSTLMNITRLFGLSFLDISGSNIDLECIEELLNLTNLEFLNLSYCDSLSNQAIHHLSSMHLKELNISYCENLTSKAFESISCFKNLETLDIRGTNIQPADFYLLAQSNIKKITISLNSNLNRRDISHFRSINPSIELATDEASALELSKIIACSDMKKPRRSIQVSVPPLVSVMLQQNTEKKF
jgi:hypothetical protein